MRSIVRAVCRAVIVGGFWLASRLLFRVQVRGLARDAREARTYYAFLHRRDTDPFLLLPVILRHRGWRAIAGEVHFGMRADSFTPGFISRVLVRPRWMAWLLRPLNAGPALRFLGVIPLDGVRLSPAEYWLRQAVRLDRRVLVGDALAPEFIRALAAQAGVAPERLAHLRLSSLLRWRFQPFLQSQVSASLFAEAWKHRMTRQSIDRLKHALAEVGAWLDRGGSIFGSPEGGLSPDGKAGPISGGFHRVMRSARQDITIAPVAIVYDFITTGRLSVCISLGSPIARANRLSLTGLDERLLAGWAQCACFTCTQLGSDFLIQRVAAGMPRFHRDEIAQAVRDEAVRLASAGKPGDRALFSDRGVKKRVRRFLIAARRRDLVRDNGGGYWTALPRSLTIDVPPGEVAYDRQPLAYAWHEARDLLTPARAD